MSRELTCDEAQPLSLERAADVTLKPDTLLDLDAHLKGCADCRAFVEKARAFEDKITKTLRESPELNDPVQAAADAARVLAAIEENESQRATAQKANARRTPWAAALLVAAVAIFAAGLGLGDWWAPGPSSGVHAAGVKELKAERDEARARNKELERELEGARARIKELERE